MKKYQLMYNSRLSCLTSMVTCLLLIYSINAIQGQAANNNLIVKVDPEVIYERDQLQAIFKDRATEVLFPELGLVLVKGCAVEDRVLFDSLSSVKGVWNDHTLSQRSDPNDPLYGDQWAIRISKIDEVWDVYPSGVTANGDKIVVAILDDGYDIDHRDLANVWHVNPNEIDGNNIDDDNNGFVDDVIGINVTDNNGTHPEENHGTSAASLLGAEANNNEGIAGAGGSIKVLPISNVRSVSRIIKGYNYIYDLRRDYNMSGGSEGAFIAITSYSGGVDDIFPTDGIFKEWCTLYDLLGQEGILNFGGPTNRNVDVDEVGDMPTTCESPYLLTVTSLKRDASHDKSTANGKQHVDIAAPGNNVLAAWTDDTYDDFDGTSAATPMAAGTGALLFALPCENFGRLLISNPAQSALLVKDAIIQGVTKTEEFSSLVASGGYLNAIEAVKIMAEECDEVLIKNEPGPLNITSISQIGKTISVDYITPNFNSHFLRVVDPLGRILAYNSFTPVEFGRRSTTIELPEATRGPIYLTLGNGDRSVSQGFFFRR